MSAFVAKLFLREECLFAIENASKKSEDQNKTVDSLKGGSQEAGSVRENERGTFFGLRTFSLLLISALIYYAGSRLIIENYEIIL